MNRSRTFPENKYTPVTQTNSATSVGKKIISLESPIPAISPESKNVYFQLLTSAYRSSQKKNTFNVIAHPNRCSNKNIGENKNITSATEPTSSPKKRRKRE